MFFPQLKDIARQSEARVTVVPLHKEWGRGLYFDTNNNLPYSLETVLQMEL